MTIQPDPEVWPVCPVHSRPWILRRAYSLIGPHRWVWMSDCKKSCKAEAVMHDKNGLVDK